MKSIKQNIGFTLVELIVSVGITAVLMIGISVFFSSTFRNMFAAREEVGNTQGQFVVSTILDGKFVNAQKVQQLGGGGSFAVIKNDMDKGDLPFTYISRDGMTPPISPEGHVVFKDFFVFNGKSSTGEVSTDTQIPNPGGIVAGGMNNYFVTAPLENRIYNCPNSLNACTSGSPFLNVEGLNQPTDIDMGTSALYVADAGNNRVVAITNFLTPSPTVTPLATGLNYPTGLAYYSPKPGEEYLFVADTYNHLVERIDLSDNSIETVVGGGNDEDCNTTSYAHEHTALFCKLRFPTDVMLATDDKSYYVADTGNGRILKVQDPALDPMSELSNREFSAKLAAASQISKIEFVFPPGTQFLPFSEGTDLNDLHKGKFSVNGSTVTYSLSVPMTEDIPEDVETCSPNPTPPPVQICEVNTNFTGFRVDPSDNIFVNGDSVKIEGNDYSISDANTIYVSPADDEIEYDDGTIVRISNDFTALTYTFHFNLSNVQFAAPGFNLVQTKIYDASAVPVLLSVPPDRTILRIGDGVLGTSEDTISVYDGGFDFPNGLGFDASGSFVFSPTPEYDLNFPSYDYVSNFQVKDFKFDEPNGGDVLELYFMGKLGEDAEGESRWQDYTLDSDVAIP